MDIKQYIKTNGIIKSIVNPDNILKLYNKSIKEFNDMINVELIQELMEEIKTSIKKKNITSEYFRSLLNKYNNLEKTFDKEGNNLIHITTMNLNFEYLKILLENKYNPNIPNIKNYKTTFEILEEQKNKEYVNYIITKQLLKEFGLKTDKYEERISELEKKIMELENKLNNFINRNI